MDSSPVYHGKDYGPIWRCDPCDAHVGCHQGTTQPKGLPANKELRRARMDAHRYFDNLWERKMCKERCSKREARWAGYVWLQGQLKLQEPECHIGMMDLERCNAVIDVCKPYYRRFP